MESREVFRSLAALAQPVRLHVLRALVVAGPSDMTPWTMADGLGIPPNTLSFQLKGLLHAGLVTQERTSRNIIYRVAFDQMSALLADLTENCCQGQACLAETTAASWKC